MTKPRSAGELLSKVKRDGMIECCPVRAAKQKGTHYCDNCPLVPWCNPKGKADA